MPRTRSAAAAAKSAAKPDKQSPEALVAQLRGGPLQTPCPSEVKTFDLVRSATSMQSLRGWCDALSKDTGKTPCFKVRGLIGHVLEKTITVEDLKHGGPFEAFARSHLKWSTIANDGIHVSDSDKKRQTHRHDAMAIRVADLTRDPADRSAGPDCSFFCACPTTTNTHIQQNTNMRSLVNGCCRQGVARAVRCTATGCHGCQGASV